MKRITSLVAVAVAAMAMTAAMGVATASAQSTVLCANETKPCPANGVLPSGTRLHTGSGGFSSKGLTIKSDGSTLYRCTSSYMAFTSTAKTASFWLPAESELLTQPGSCDWRQDPSGTCTDVTYNNPESSFQPTGDGLIRIGGKANGGAVPLTISLTCKNPTFSAQTITCEYESAYGVMGLSINDLEGTAVMNEEPLHFVKISPSWFPASIGCNSTTALTMSVNHITPGGSPYIRTTP